MAELARHDMATRDGGLMTAPTVSNGKPTAASEQGIIRLEPLPKATWDIPIVGITPFIPHKWGAKALRMMREAQQGPKARTKKEPKNPEQEAEDATYRLEDGTPGAPATGFKAAIADAARFFDGVTIVQLKQAIFVEGEGPDQLVRIEGESYIREDTPRNATGVADLRYRRCFEPWSAVLRVTFISTLIDLNSVLALVDAAGNGGVGDWRPSSPKSKSGTFGRFRVDSDRDVKQVR
jgi:hypothetical protein